MKHFFLIACLVCSSLQALGDEISTLLNKMVAADQSLNFEGTLVYLQGPHVETMRVVHAIDETGGVHERITSLSGDTREVYLNDRHLFAIMPRTGRIVIESRQSSADTQLPSNLYLGNKNYDYALHGTERIAGRNCRVVSIYPRDSFRFGYRFCIEEKTGLLLKALTQDHAGKTYEQMMYTSISEPESISADKYIPVLKSKEYELQKSVQKKPGPADVAETSSWLVQRFSQDEVLPPGFDMVFHSMQDVPGAPGPVEHFVLSDGIATLSVFISEILTDTPLEEGAGQSGCMNMYSRITENFHVTVIGAVPEKTIQFVAKSLHYRP